MSQWQIIRGPLTELDQACRSSSFAELWDTGLRYFVVKYQAEGDPARQHAQWAAVYCGRWLQCACDSQQSLKLALLRL